MRVIFHKLYPYAPYLNEYIGIEEDFPSTTDQETFNGYVNKLRELAENNHKSKYPHLYTDSNQSSALPIPEVQMQTNPQEELIKAFIEDINNCISIDETNKFGQQIGLIAYEQAANQYPEIKQAYDKKYQELSK